MFSSPSYPFPMLHLLEKWEKKVQKGMSDSEKNWSLLGLKDFSKGWKEWLLGDVSEDTLVFRTESLALLGKSEDSPP